MMGKKRIGEVGMIRHKCISVELWEIINTIALNYLSGKILSHEYRIGLESIAKNWQKELDRKARTAKQVSEDARAKGVRVGRRRLELPSGSILAERIKAGVAVKALARELGVSAPTLRARIKESGTTTTVEE